MKLKHCLICFFLFLFSVAFGLTGNQVHQSSLQPKQNFAPRIRLKNGTSTNWGGYAIETNLLTPQTNAVSDVKGSWVVPNVDCSNTGGVNTYSATWIGIDGYSDNTVEQTGTEQDCLSGAPTYYAWYEMYPKANYRVGLSVSVGDKMSAEVAYVSRNTFRLTLSDLTTGQQFTTLQSSKAHRESAEWIMEAPWSGGVLPLAKFGVLSFTGASATLNGHTGSIGDNTWQNDEILMTNSSGAAKATPSSLTASGSAFTMTWNSSN